VFVWVSGYWLAFAEEADLEGEVEKQYHGRILYPYCHNALYINSLLWITATKVSVAERSKTWVCGR